MGNKSSSSYNPAMQQQQRGCGMGNSCSCCVSLEECWLPFKKNMSCCGQTPPNLPVENTTEEKPKPNPTPLVTNNKELLSITGWNWCHKENGRHHHTGKYHGMAKGDGPLVMRRGQAITMKVATSRGWREGVDKMGVIFTLKDCKNPQFGNGTQEGAVLGGAPCEGGWGLEVEEVGEGDLVLKITPPVKCIVGEWTVEADVTSGGETHSSESPTPLCILFNPWCEEDPTYMEDESHRTEYVLSDTGLIWRGSSTSLRPCPWHFGQFDEHILPCVLRVLSGVCRMSAVNRGDPVKVARALSAGMNSPDNQGVLVGNWSGEYDGGVSPTTWSGSADILQQYWEKKSPVKFGQCWVFSGLVTTACRALGLPARPVTNFSSAHDTHNSLTIDYFFDADGEKIERLNSDSIWNFHVWNECWMKRSDLGTEFDGWQIIDATPQEESDGQYRCGPTSQKAVRSGRIDLPYDVPFVYAEVNADKLFWKFSGKDRPLKLIGKRTSGVGLNVSTKEVGRFRREDITLEYKHGEDTDGERRVMRDALRRCDAAYARFYLNQDVEDIQLTLEDHVGGHLIGQSMDMKVLVRNKSDLPKTVSVVLRADATLYTGKSKGLVKKQVFKETIPANDVTELSVSVPYTEYVSHLADQCGYRVACLASVDDTEYEYFNEQDYRLKKPDVEIKTAGPLKVNKSTPCRLSFTNPLPVPLTRACFYVLASQCKSQYVRIKEAIPAGGEAACDVTLLPSCAGESIITATFLSKELDDVDGYMEADIADEDGAGEGMANEGIGSDEKDEEAPLNE